MKAARNPQLTLLASPSTPSTPPIPVRVPAWSYASLVGRLSELCGHGATAVLSLAFTLVREAQEQGETTAWIMDRSSSFHPPDVHDLGVDLAALLVVRPRAPAEVPRAADQLLRSGAFGLVVLDLPQGIVVSMPLLSRLLGLAQKHGAAVLFLSEGRPDGAALGSLVSLRGRAQRERRSDGDFLCSILTLKDKRGAPGVREEVFHGPAGLS